MTLDVRVLFRTLRHLIPDKDANGLLAAAGVTFWAYDPMGEEICWQSQDPAAPLGYRILKMHIRKALKQYSAPDQVHLLNAISSALEIGISQDNKLTLLTDSGPLHITLTAARFSGNKTPIVVGHMRERARDNGTYEYTLGLQRELNSIFTSIDKAVLIIDTKGIIKTANKHLLKYFGVYDARLLIGRDVRTIPNHLGKTLVAKFIHALSPASTPMKGKEVFSLANNASMELDYQLHSFALNTKHGGATFLAEPVKDNKDADAATILDSIPTPILVADVKTARILYANKVGMGELGLTREQIGMELLTDRLISSADLIDLLRVLNAVGWDLGRVWEIDTHLGLKRHYRVRSCFQGSPESGKMILEFLPAKFGKDAPGNEKAKGFFSRLTELSFH